MDAREIEMQHIELQQELQRFTARFSDRVTQAVERLERSRRREVRMEALHKNLLYVSSAIEIASGPYNEVNLLDMIVFVRLSKSVLESHWIPVLYRDEGAELLDAFVRADEELARLAERTMSEVQREQLAAVTADWLRENPAQIRVEGLRLADFSQAAGRVAGRAAPATGLLASVKRATGAADQALLLSERALFLVHRMPSLLRLQARLAAREVVDDALRPLAEGPPVRRAFAQLVRAAAGGLVRRLGVHRELSPNPV